MKRILLTLSIAAAVLLAFAACGPEDEPVDPPVDPTEEEEEIVLRLAPAHDTMFEAGGVMFEMKLVPGGTFTMGATTANGSPCYDPDADIMEQPPHTVTLDAFLMADIEVSQFLYFAVMGSNPSMVSDLALPVHNVSFTNAQRFVDSLSRLTGFRFRLPTEAEWEYAAKGRRTGRRAYALCRQRHFRAGGLVAEERRRTGASVGTAAAQCTGIV